MTASSKWTAINDRKRDLVFVGRLIKEKGLQNVLLALDHLREKEILLSLMVVGSGPDAEWYKEESKKLGLNNQVTFVGAVSPAQIAEIYNVHKIAVVPSTWEEPFGIVALEGIACGCAVVGSISGGLPEAIGPCGLTYPKMSVGDLAARLEQLVLEPGFWRRCKSTEQHLARHTRTAVAAKYLRFMSDGFPNLAFAGGRSTNTADSLGLVEATHG